MIGEVPAGRDVRRRPGRGRERPDQPVEVGRDGRVLGHEPGEVQRARVGHERVAVDLAEPELVGPRLDDREMVEIVAVQRVADPAPRLGTSDRVIPKALGEVEQPRVAPPRAGRGLRRAASTPTARGGVRCSGRSHRRRSRRRRATPRSSMARAVYAWASSCQSAMCPTCSASDQSVPPASDGAAPGRCQAAASRPAQLQVNRSHSAVSSAHRSRSGARRSTARMSARGARRRSGAILVGAWRRPGTADGHRPPVRGSDAGTTVASSWSPSSTVRR